MFSWNNAMPSTTKNTKKRKVSFNSNVACLLVLHLNDYTNDEFQASFYSPEEIQRIRQEVRDTLDEMKQGNKLDETKHCRRGLECKTPAGLQRRNHNKRTTRKAVLQIQEEQFAEWGDCDPEQLARVSWECTKEAKVSAYITGLSDTFFARHQVDFNEAFPAVGSDTKELDLGRPFECAVMVRRQSSQTFPLISVSA